MKITVPDNFTNYSEEEYTNGSDESTDLVLAGRMGNNLIQLFYINSPVSTSKMSDSEFNKTVYDGLKDGMQKSSSNIQFNDTFVDITVAGEQYSRYEFSMSQNDLKVNGYLFIRRIDDYAVVISQMSIIDPIIDINTLITTVK